jgi:hypothetical protein
MDLKKNEKKKNKKTKTNCLPFPHAGPAHPPLPLFLFRVAAQFPAFGPRRPTSALFPPSLSRSRRQVGPTCGGRPQPPAPPPLVARPPVSRVAVPPPRPFRFSSPFPLVRRRIHSATHSTASPLSPPVTALHRTAAAAINGWPASSRHRLARPFLSLLRPIKGAPGPPLHPAPVPSSPPSPQSQRCGAPPPPLAPAAGPLSPASLPPPQAPW